MARTDRPPLRQVLSDNLKELMRHHGLTIVGVAEADTTNLLSKSAVGRIHAASHTTDIERLEALAGVFKLEPWQLLVEDLNPARLPRRIDAGVIHEIRSFVSQGEGQPPQTGEAPSEEKLATPADKRRTTYGRTAELGSALQQSIKVTTGNKPNEGRKPQPVPKPRSRR